jgi:hypothetical protein
MTEEGRGKGQEVEEKAEKLPYNKRKRGGKRAEK